jgi:hypothetical protein
MLTVNNNPFTIEPLNENAPAILKDSASKIPFPYWVSAGTALGLYRDNDFPHGDTDIDFAALGFPHCDEMLYEALEDYPLIRTIYDGDKPMQIAFKKDGVIVDFYFHWEEGDNCYNESESGKQVMVKSMYESLEPRETQYGTFSFLKDIEKYLETRYGADWKIPAYKKPVNYV